MLKSKTRVSLVDCIGGTDTINESVPAGINKGGTWHGNGSKKYGLKAVADMMRDFWHHSHAQVIISVQFAKPYRILLRLLEHDCKHKMHSRHVFRRFDHLAVLIGLFPQTSVYRD